MHDNSYTQYLRQITVNHKTMRVHGKEQTLVKSISVGVDEQSARNRKRNKTKQFSALNCGKHF